MMHVITVDTEFSTHKDDIGIVGRINGEEFGVSKIMEICEKYSVKATFFVDVYDYKKIEEDKLRNICVSIKNRGHDLQLHTHPDGLYDKNRGYMARYALKEQIDIIKKGKEIFKDWLGIEPIAHRAGDWGANYDTLEALRQNDIKIDCSMFLDWALCGLNEPILTKNKPLLFNDILELPATCFKSPTVGIFKPYHYVSTDGNSLKEIAHIVKNLEKSGVNITVSTFHSFSFLKWTKDRTEYRVDYAKMNKFDFFLKEITKDGKEKVKTISEIYKIFKKNPELILNSSDVVPKSNLFFCLKRIIERL